MKNLSLVCLGLLVFGSGCGKSRVEMAAWSKPVEMAKSSDSLSTSFSLHKWNGTLLALGGDDGTYEVRVFDNDKQSWKAFPTTDPNWSLVDVDPNGNNIVIARASLSNEKMDARFAVGSLSQNGDFSKGASPQLSLNRNQLFPNALPNLEMTLDGRPINIAFAGGVIEGKDIRVPYCVSATPVERKGHQVGYRGDLAVSANGVFASSDSGRTWCAEMINTRDSESPVMAKTKAAFYYFAKAVAGGDGTYGLWFSRCPAESATWSSPETMNKTVARKLSESLHAIGQGDIVHLCWLDARNEGTRWSLARPRVENYQVAYSRRKDSDSAWSKDVILSKGLRWSYAPSMSVEGNNLIVAWAGANGMADRNEFGPSDIYYAVSKDGGIKWTGPIKVTGGAKSGITSGRPQVVLHKGVIHLFYVQGTLNYKKVAAGMVKLNQPSWPILYQQRPFPN